MFERLDESARDVMRAAYDCALSFGDNAITTEHLLFALATTGTLAAKLLTRAGCGADEVRRAVASRPVNPRRREHAALLATLGIDLAAVRDRAAQTFGGDAVQLAAGKVRPPRPRRSLWSRVSCSTPLPTRRCDSPLAGEQLGLIPPVKRLLHRATRDAAPGLATPAHLLLALVTGDEPAGEILADLGVDLPALADRTRSAIDTAAR